MRNYLLTVFVLFWGTYGCLFAGEFEPGKETSITFGASTDTTETVRVYVPKDYTADRDFPVVLHYYRVGPYTFEIRKKLKLRHAIVIGMGYRESHNFKGDPRTLVIKSPEHLTEVGRKEHTAIDMVLDELKKKGLRIDPRKIYLTSGNSFGGWMVSILANTQPERFAGIAMRGAGRGRVWPATPDPAAFRDKPIYIENGTLDRNYVFSRHAEAVWSSYGARVHFNTLKGGGSSSTRGVNLREWLLREIAPETLREEAVPWLKERLATSRATIPMDHNAGAPSEAAKIPMNRYIDLLYMFRDPRFELAAAETQQAVRADLNGLVKKHREIHVAMVGERKLKEIMVKEMRVTTLAQMKYIRDAYGELKTTGLEPFLQSFAYDCHERVSKAYALAVEGKPATKADATRIDMPTPVIRR